MCRLLTRLLHEQDLGKLCIWYDAVTVGYVHDTNCYASAASMTSTPVLI